MRQSRIRVLIVEDNANLLECLKLEIGSSRELCCIGAFTSFEQAKSTLAQRKPDVLLLDLILPGMDGVEATKLVRSRWPRIKIVIFTGSSDEDKIFESFRAGADGFLLKTTPRAELVRAIERAYEGGSPISPQVETALVSWFRRQQSLLPHLSPTERLILDLLNRGMPQKQAASSLKMSYHTLRMHINSILEKTGVSSVARVAYLHRQASY